MRHAVTADAVRAWLVARLAEASRRDPDAIDVRDQFASYGLSSIAAIGLTADIEDWLDIPLSPLAIWDHPTIESLVEHIELELARRRRSGAESGDGG